MDRVAMLKEFLAENPADAFARYGLAMEYFRTGQREAALAEFNTIVEKNPDYVPAYQMAGQMLYEAERSGEARQWLQNGMAAARRTDNQHAASEMQGMLDLIG